MLLTIPRYSMHLAPIVQNQREYNVILSWFVLEDEEKPELFPTFIPYI